MEQRATSGWQRAVVISLAGLVLALMLPACSSTDSAPDATEDATQNPEQDQAEPAAATSNEEDPPPQNPTPGEPAGGDIIIDIVLTNHTAAPVYIQATTWGSGAGWYQVTTPSGTLLPIFDSCEYSNCDVPGGGVCGRGFATTQAVATSANAAATWNGTIWEPVGSGSQLDTCEENRRAPAPPLVVSVCWGLHSVVDNSFGGGDEYADDVQCATQQITTLESSTLEFLLE